MTAKGTGGVKHAGWRLIACPKCGAPAGQDCQRLDGPGFVKTRHELRAMHGRIFKRRAAAGYVRADARRKAWNQG